MATQNDEFILEGLPALRGVLADLANNFLENAYRPHRISAYLSALVFGAGICSRNFAFDGSYSNVYVVVFGASGSGKADLEKMITRWSDDIHCPDLIMNGSSFSSDAGVHSAIVSQPQAIMCVDEFGRTLANLASDIIGKTALVALTKAYTLSDMSMKPKKYSKDKRNTPKNDTDREQIIIRPAMTLLGFGTHSQMSEILCEENFESGDMSRYMFFYIPEAIVDYQLKDTKLPYRVFDRIAEALFLAGNYVSRMEGAEYVKLSDYNAPLKVPVKCSLEPGNLNLKELDRDQQKKTLECEDIIEKTLQTRHLDKAKRLAIVLSLLNQPYKSMQTVSSIRNNGVIITQEAMSDALEIAGKSNKVMKKYQAERQTYPPRIVRQGEAIYNLLHINGNLSATREEIKNSGINVNSNDWKLISDYLEDCGVECVQDNSKRGRPLNVYQIPLTDSKGAVRTTEFKQIKK